ncbi:head GIN domain-containing protein [uncultured Flavobacterium sp.]|uniref:head GIN domain-containing protein n=1 Tax=uncultured Flavobacterium sp. TaxID=165435 RepID=UPI0030ECAA70|tara:strand:+ start:43301 stop:44029 length:729 start_codon:yes stop_codon:yes gene_type:complete
MKKVIVLFSLFFLFSCDENQLLESSGEIVSKEILVGFFDKINISEGIELHITDEITTKVEITAGENIIDKVTFSVIDNQLFIDAKSATKTFQSYEPIKIYISIDDLDTIYSSSQYNVYSENVLNFNNFHLQSGLFEDTASGEFHLEVNCNSLIIEDNRASFYNISGSTNYLSVAFYNGDERFDGTNLIAQEVYVFQRSSNDIIVNPQQKISGTIYSTGNVILKNNPPIVEVQVFYQGQLIFN